MHENEHPIWLGSVRPETEARPVWHPGHNRRLHEIVVTGGRPLMLIGRNSGSSGRSGAREAAKNLHEAARALARRTGFDVTGLIPSIDDLVEMLMRSQNVVKSRDGNGREFKNRFCLIDLSDHGVVVSFSTGSAHKVDDDLNQPHVRWIQRTLRELSPAGFFASKFNRVSRVMWQTGLLIEELRALEAREGSMWACDDQYGEWTTDQSTEIMHAFRGQQASAEAREFKRNAARAQLAQTGAEMVDGLVLYAVSGGIPPGLFAFRHRRTGRMMLSIDSPGFYLDEDDVQYGLPNVRDADGELVDQAETVRWFLREYARPGVRVREVFEGLVARRFSTHALRVQREQGPSAFYGGPTKPVETYASDACNSWVRSIFNNLSMYETGMLRRSIGPEETDRFVISNVFPDAGWWATTEDFERIRAKLAEDKRRQGDTRAWSWSGMPIMIDGVPGFLKPRRGQTSRDDVAWTLSVRGARPKNNSGGLELAEDEALSTQETGAPVDAEDARDGGRA